MEKIWEKWKEHYQNNMIDINEICKDGIANEDIKAFHNQPVRILFIGKECNDWKGGDMRELARTGPKHLYLYNLSRWATGLLKGFPEFSQIGDNRNILNESLNKIALINLKKTSGSSSSDMTEISAYAKHDEALLLEQIELINPNVIVTLSTHDIVMWLLKLKVSPDKPNQKPYFSDNNNSWIIPWCHPSFRGISATKYNELRDFVAQDIDLIEMLRTT